MRRAVFPAMALLLGAVLLTGCKEEPDFDSQYDKTSKEIEARAKKLDAEMNQQMQAMDRELEVQQPMRTPDGDEAARTAR